MYVLVVLEVTKLDDDDGVMYVLVDEDIDQLEVAYVLVDE